MSHPESGKQRCLTAREIDDFVNGRVSPAGLPAIESHLESCPGCAGRLGSASSDPLVEKLGRFEFGSHAVPAGAAAKPFQLGPHSRYQLLAELGSGGMGQVFKARHRLMKRVVALKTIRPELMHNREAVLRFVKEARAAARLSHPNIVSAFDAEQEGDHHFLVMEFVDGEPLNRIVNRCGPLDAETAAGYIRQAAEGLQHAFERGMVHRDIKPHNLMLTSGGVVKILDFGLSRIFQNPPDIDATDTGTATDDLVLTFHDTRLGTDGYVAPEQARDARSADVRSDIYSLGCTFFFLLTNRPPWFGAPPATPDAVPDVTRLRPDLPRGLPEVLSRMMQPDPADRYQTPAKLVAALKEIAFGPGTIAASPATGSGTAPAAKTGGSADRRTRHFRWWVLAAAGGALIGAWVIYRLLAG